MTLLDFARGPALHWSLTIFVVGILWRLLGAMFMLKERDLSTPRGRGEIAGGLLTIASRSWPHPPYRKNTLFQHVTGYLFHIGLFVVILAFVPHIEFFKGLLGFSWPGLPNNIVMFSGAITLAVLIMLVIRRMAHPVLRRISGPDDYISWLATTLPLATGLVAFGHLGARYETLLAIHILSVEFLMLWFPFGKLMHSFFIVPSRFEMGATYGRRGVRI